MFVLDYRMAHDRRQFPGLEPKETAAYTGSSYHASPQSTPSSSPRPERRSPTPPDPLQISTGSQNSPSLLSRSRWDRLPRALTHARSSSVLRQEATTRNVEVSPSRHNNFSRPRIGITRLHSQQVVPIHQTTRMTTPPSEQNLLPEPLRTSQLRTTVDPERTVTPVVATEPPRSAPPTQTRFQEDHHRHTSLGSIVSPLTPESERQTSPRRANSYRKSTFRDEADVGLFAEALSGLGGDMSLCSPSTRQSPPATRSHLQPHPTVSAYSTSSASRSIPQPTITASTGHSRDWSARSREPHELAISYDSPHMPSRSLTTPVSAEPFTATTGHMPPTLFLEALQGVPDNEERDDDDELPSYAESQREAAEQSRRAALTRAAELESRWAATSYGRR
ncbi:MAG: hypothetical protein M1828_005004 [Chrysothrix sp. TS-e1954]|nr:MAG: hypothetical protein M1828_005004 [Chrysothrix sp. TS-e1954]